MIEADILRSKFSELAGHCQRHASKVLGVGLAFCFILCGAVLAFNPQWVPAVLVGRLFQVLLILIFFCVFVSWLVAYTRRPSLLDLARQLESKERDLNGLAITAVGLLEKEKLTYPESRVVSQLTDHSATHDWAQLVIGKPSLFLTRRGVAFVALVLCVTMGCLNFRVQNLQRSLVRLPAPADGAKSASHPYEVTLTPGDVEVERGSRVVIEATFRDHLPNEVYLITKSMAGKVLQKQPMKSALEAGRYSGLVGRADEDFRYEVEFDSHVSKSHKVTTFEHPKLVKAYAILTPPAYSGLPAKEVINPTRVTVLEGGSVQFHFEINKPIQAAELFGEDKTILPLVPKDQPTHLTALLKPIKSQKWRLHLVDDKERSNKNPPWFHVSVKTNEMPKLELVFPKKDIQVSPIQELSLEARVWDDLSVVRSGLILEWAGQTSDIPISHAASEPNQKVSLRHRFDLEGKGVRPQQLIRYYFWAEDRGPKGEVRRSMSDLFFAEVRHFEDIFREGDSPPPSEEKKQKNQSDELVDLQKQIVNATWKILRESNSGRPTSEMRDDVNVIRQSQELAMSQTKEAMEKVEDPQISQALTEAWKSMKDVVTPLDRAMEEQKREPLHQALAFEQNALEWLHRAQSQEHVINRGTSKSMAGGKAKQMQQQLMNLELKQEEQRYEEEKVASEEASAEQEENLQILNRLKELARRQEALAEKMKQLESQLAKNQTPEKRQELEEQLKDLQEEQKQLLNDVDALSQRMEESTPSDNLAEAKKDLEETRQQVNEATEQLEQKQLSAASQAATRAQRSLEEIGEDFRESTAKQFSKELRQMQQQAKAVEERQKQIADQMEQQKAKTKETADTSGELENLLQGSEVAKLLQEQEKEVSELLEHMQQVSGQAEQNHPLLHRKLYEALRDAKTKGLEKNLEDARMQARYGEPDLARESERLANQQVGELKMKVDSAAESVLGSEKEALQTAKKELDQLIEKAKQEDSTLASPSEQAAQGKNQAEKPAEKPGEKPGEASGQKAEIASQASDKKGSGKPTGQEPAEKAESSRAPSPASKNSLADAGGQNSPSSDSPSPPDGQKPLFFEAEEAQSVSQARPFTGGGYQSWSDRLRNVEELLQNPELSSQAAGILDRAREMYLDHERNNQAPQVEHLRSRILEPLVELRDRVAEEIAKKDSKNPAVPVDRDPVPAPFRELVKRYYKELGEGSANQADAADLSK